MKTYEQLSPVEQDKAHEVALTKLLKEILEGFVTFRGNASLDGRIKAACKKADEMRTPWFAGEYIMETCGFDLQCFAKQDARKALYREPGDCILQIW